MDNHKFEELIMSVTGGGHWWGRQCCMFDCVFGGLSGARQTLAAVGLFGSEEYESLTLLLIIHNSNSEFMRLLDLPHDEVKKWKKKR